MNRANRLDGLLTQFGMRFGCIVLLLMRLFWGWHFFLAGKGKLVRIEPIVGFFGELGIPFPFFSAYLVGTVETVCGLLLLFGLFSRLAAVPLTITMIIAYSTAHTDALKTIFSDPDKFMAQEPFLFLLTALLVLSFGPGRLSLDFLIGRFKGFGKSCC
ncbi:MAG: DoxX family protein [bacterium]|nr:DoxX family protein [bacterium]